MHTQAVLQKFFRDSFPEIHSKRLECLTLAVLAVTRGAQVSITTMGRYLTSTTRIKHRVKRMDRLVGNRFLGADRDRFYKVLAHRLLNSCPRPVIVIDWSDFSGDQQQQLLRASIPVGGRALTVYEELHPDEKLGNRVIQHQFLDRLRTLIPDGCRPIIVADAGFRAPFFRYVQDLGWHWLGRIRNRDRVMWEGAPYEWISAKSLYPLATVRARDLGPAQWVRYAPLAGRLILVRQRRVGRQDRTLRGAPRRSHVSRKHARRASEPWLLIASPSLHACHCKQIVGLYKTRMQIEENFRDTKSTTVGLGIARSNHTSFERATNLLLIAALASFVLWVIGRLARSQRWDQFIRVNSSSRSPDYSDLFLARLVIQHYNGRLPPNCINQAYRFLRANQLCLAPYLWG